VQNDAQGKGVFWSLTQSGISCIPNCGTLSVTGNNSATYTAPANIPQQPSVLVAATSVAAPAKSASAAITISSTPNAPNPKITVSITPLSVSIPISQTQRFDALVQNDAQNQGVAWTLTQAGVACSPDCGMLSAFTTQAAIYTAPSVPNPLGVTITATSIADSNQSASATITVITVSSSSGSNQWVDISKFGARSIDIAPTATARCTAGSSTVTLAAQGFPQDFTKFQNGDSIRLDNCGPPTTVTTPTGLTVSPGMNAGGTPAVPVPSLGTAQYSYQVIACDRSGGCSAASTVASTATGAATLGRVTASISRMSLSNNLMTVTTNSAHGFVSHALVCIQYFSTQTAQFEGCYIVRDTPSPTKFTFLTSIDSRIGGTPTLDSSGGTAIGFNCNVLSWLSTPNAWKYFIYGRTPTSGKLIGVAEPGTTTWQDYGSPMMDNFSFPSFVPATPPNSATNQYLLSTISGGGGTASVTITDNVVNGAQGVLAVMGSDAAILAAFKAARQGTLFIPKGTYSVAGYLDVSAFGPTYVEQAGTLQIVDTVQLGPGVYWRGWSPGAGIAFGRVPSPWIYGSPGSYPSVYLTGGATTFDDVTFQAGARNGTLSVYADRGAQFGFESVTFAAGPGDLFGYMDRHAIFRTGGFDFSFSGCTFITDQEPTGLEADLGYTFLPSVLFAPLGSVPTGDIHVKDSWFVGKSAVEVNQSNPGSQGGAPYNIFENIQTQNGLLPVFVASNYPFANTGTNYRVSFDGYAPSDYPTPMTGNWDGNGMIVSLKNLSINLQGNRPLVVGNPTVFESQQGGTAGTGTGGGWFAGGGGQVGYLLPPPSSPPLLAAVAGGALPVGSHTYQVAWTDAFGNSTTLGPSATITIVAGMQTVAVTPQPDAPPGAVGWQMYRDGALTGPSGGVCGPFALGTSQTDTTFFAACGNSQPSQNTAMSSGQGINGLETTQIVLTGGGHKSVISGTFSADRKLNVPDVSATIAVKIASGSVTMPTDAIAPSACSTVVSAVAVGVLPTDVVGFSDNASPSADAPDLRLKRWPGTDSVNFQYCNLTTSSLTPAKTTLNWQVVR